MPRIPQATLALDRNSQGLEIGRGALGGRAHCWWQRHGHHHSSSWNQRCLRQEGTSQSHLGRKGPGCCRAGSLHYTPGTVRPRRAPGGAGFGQTGLVASTCFAHLPLSLTALFWMLPPVVQDPSSHPTVSETRPPAHRPGPRAFGHTRADVFFLSGGEPEGGGVSFSFMRWTAEWNL